MPKFVIVTEQFQIFKNFRVENSQAPTHDQSLSYIIFLITFLHEQEKET